MGVTLKSYDYTKMPLFVRTKAFLRDGGTVLDVGPGIRPQTLVDADRHICVEPHGEYADALEAEGFEVIRKTATDALRDCEPVDTIVALDVIEHMEKADGLRFIEQAKRKAKQVIVFTPLGFLPQDSEGPTDAWGLHGQEWQKHRSGWLPKEFDGWVSVVDRNFHDHLKAGAFFAVWQA